MIREKMSLADMRFNAYPRLDNVKVAFERECGRSLRGICKWMVETLTEEEVAVIANSDWHIDDDGIVGSIAPRSFDL